MVVAAILLVEAHHLNWTDLRLSPIFLKIVCIYNTTNRLMQATVIAMMKIVISMRLKIISIYFNFLKQISKAK